MTAIDSSSRRAIALAVLISCALVGAYFALKPPEIRLLASYTSGHAVVAIDGGTPATFDLVDRGALFDASRGASLAWSTAAGWYLSLGGPLGGVGGALPDEMGSKGTLQVDAYRDGRWAGFDSTVCAIDYAEISTMRIAGSVRCHGLVWYDASSVERIKALDSPPFDLDVTFEATGDGTVVLPKALPSPTGH